MDEVKRLNYFNSQFLIDKDFKDEQSYHRNLRQLHNQFLHSWGIADGLVVSQVSGNSRQLAISPGIAIDNQGREIVLPDTPSPANIDLTPAGAVTTIDVAIAYQDFPSPTDLYRDNENFVRTTERPKILIYGSGANQTVSERLEFTTGSVPTDGSVVELARVTLQGGNVTGIDSTLRKSISPVIAANAIDNPKIAPGAVTADKLAANAVGNAQLAAGAVTGDKLAAAVQTQINSPILSINTVGTDGTNRNITLARTNAITITDNAANRTITIGENHSATTNNPHQTTATQIDSQGGTNQIVARINAGTGTINDARIDAAIARNTRFDPATGHSHDGTDSRRIAPTNLAGVRPTVTADNLNILTGGVDANASSLHFHPTIPAQTGVYHVPMAPMRIGTSPEFESNLTTITARTGVAAFGRIPLLFPNFAQLTRLVIVTTISTATTTFQLSAQIQRVPSNGTALTNVTPLISITAAGTDNRLITPHLVDLSAGFYWLVLTMQTPAAGGNLNITQLFVEYTLNRLF